MTYQLDHDLESMKNHRYNAPGKKALPGLLDGCGFLFVLNDEQTLCFFHRYKAEAFARFFLQLLHQTSIIYVCAL